MKNFRCNTLTYPPARGAAAGFTLVELLVVISVLGILTAIALPSFGALSNSVRMASVSAQLRSDLNLARSESINRNSRMLVCVRNTAGTACAAGTNWQAGWLVCYDNGTTATPNNGVADGECDAAPGDGSRPNPIVLRPAVSSNLTLVSSVAAIRFNPNGTQGVRGALTTASVVVGLNPAGATRTVTVTPSGHVSKQ